MLVAVLLAVVGLFPATASDSPANTICVGLILDSHSIGGSVSDTCVNVRQGTTGVGVLEAAGHSVTYRRDGLICTIDAVPDTGCSKVDNTHYWAYYHRAPDGTSWSYSVQDARTYQPANRSTEGWVYDNGSSLQPENIPASQICAGLLEPTATPSPTKTHHIAAHTHSPTPQPTAAPSTTPTPTPTKSRHHRHTPTPTPTLPAATTASAPTSTPAASTKSDSNGNATGALIAAGVIAALAAATVVGAKRRRR